MRVACVFVPQLALQSALRRSPEAQAQARAGVGAVLVDARHAGDVGIRVAAAVGQEVGVGESRGHQAEQDSAAALQSLPADALRTRPKRTSCAELGRLMDYGGAN